MEINISDTEKLERWNSDLANKLIADDVILVLYIILGICGNGIVIYVYKVRFSGNNVDRYFIPCLAMTDMMASVICSSFSLTVNMMEVTFYNNSLCKTLWFLAAFTTFSSILLLVVIAVQRYLKVVRPLGRQMDIKLNRITMSLVFLISLLCAIPTSILYGSVPFPNPHEGIVGRRCAKIKGENKSFSVFYSGLIGIFAITSIGALIGIYLRIGWTIFKQMKYGNKFMGKLEEGSATKVTSLGDSNELSDHEYKPGRDFEVTKEAIENEGKRGRKCVKQDKKYRGSKKYSNQNQHEKINRKILHKFTLMFMLITTIFFICYIPKVFIMLIEALNPKFWETFSDWDRVGILFVNRMYIINNISNPIVYAFLDLKFKKELKSLCSRK